MERNKQVVLIIFDGWGIAPKSSGNAIEEASKPFFDKLWKEYPHTLVKASGNAVGLPEGEMGNSEVGHTTLGAGTVIHSDFVRITQALSQENLILENKAFKEAFENAKKHKSTLHLNSLVSPGGVHGHHDHLFAILHAAKNYGLTNVAIHAFTDGRDTPPKSAAKYMKHLENVIDEAGIGFIASVSGRYYSMDRDNNWDRTEKAVNAIFHAKGEECFFKKPSEVIGNLYGQNKSDEFLEPLVFCDKDGNTFPLQKHDSVVFLNFRADRARQLSKKYEEFSEKSDLTFVTMTEYDKSLKSLVAFPPLDIKTTLAEQVSLAGLSQIHIAETEKYAHVTYFLNGGREDPYPNEDRFMVESRKDVKTHDQAPEMKAMEVAQKAAEALEKGINLVVLNFANPDMVGHTANFAAAVKAIEAVDSALKVVVEKAWDRGAVCFITADHGNAEELIHKDTGEDMTAHTSNPVPGILTDKSYSLKDGGGLSDVAPTILKLLGIKVPDEMTGKSLI